MRVALLQLALDGRSASRNMQRILGAIGTVARQDPAPDLIVLPGGCDSGGASPPRDAWPAVLSAVREAIALQAREWGVYIAAGLHRREATGYEPYTAVFDRDGDLALGCPGETEGPASGWLCMHLSDAGDVGCFEAQMAIDLPASVEVGRRGAIIVACVPPTSGVRERRLVESRLGALPVPATGGHLYWSVVTAAGADRAGTEVGTCLFGPDRSKLHAAGSAGEEIFVVDVPIRPASTEERMSMCAPRDHVP